MFIRCYRDVIGQPKNVHKNDGDPRPRGRRPSDDSAARSANFRGWTLTRVLAVVLQDLGRKSAWGRSRRPAGARAWVT
ncbi:hypothetical protein Zmor_012856 [Zophobas morio]|uniref:Uncharacterized protein n=1 Tax=Zophobas morio TaxID=2755281 RepID=A0AA38ME48_9CUCU|nr:hypothetical protein Zmor_012856 [Zophobas morio]